MSKVTEEKRFEAMSEETAEQRQFQGDENAGRILAGVQKCQQGYHRLLPAGTGGLLPVFD